MDSIEPSPILIWEISPEHDSRKQKKRVKHTISEIVNAFNNTGKTWQIHMAGNEPFLFPNFIELCYALSKSHFLSLSTSLSTTNTLLFAKHIPPERVLFIDACLHMTQTAKLPGGIGHFLDKVKFFQSKNFDIQIQYFMYPTFFHHVFRDLIYLNSEGIENIHFKMFRGTCQQKKYPHAYNSQIKNLIRRYADDPREIDILNRKKFFYGKPCTAGLDFFVMNTTGNLRRCTGSSASYGNLFKGTNSQDNKPRPCPFKECINTYEGLRCIKKGRAPNLELLQEIKREQFSGLFNKMTHPRN